MGDEMQLSDRIGRRMKLHDLHVLMAAVQAGSMSKAAVLLNTGQSAISRSIAELERALGVRLLDRNPQGIEPTAYGRALLVGGAAVFDDLRQTVKNIEFLADPAGGDLRIGCNAYLAATFVSGVIDRLSQLYPRIVFHLVATQTEALHRELSERNVDLLIAQRFGPFVEEHLGFEILYDDSRVVVTGVKNPLVRRRKIELADLVNEPWALPPPESALGSVYAEAFRASELGYPRRTVFTISAEARASLATTGHFLTIFSTSILKFPAPRSDLKVLPVELSMARVPIGIVTLKNRTVSPVAQLFVEHARDVAKLLAKTGA